MSVMDELPVWAKLGLIWLFLSLTFTYAVARWFRFLRDEYRGETPWEPTPLDSDYEVRWKDGQVESRRRRR